MTFDIYFPENLEFRDYINICQVARTWADGYDRKDRGRLEASLAPNLTIDYSGVVPAWGSKQYTANAFIDEWLSPAHLGLRPLATQHLLGLHYFLGVSEHEVVVEWQVIASHGRKAKGQDFANPMCAVEAESNHRSFIRHTFVKAKEDGRWRIAVIKPSVIFQPGDFMHIRRPEEEEESEEKQ